ncbi:IGHMBP2 family helicase [bacterium]|nr:IGHMBP2 family helicase [bacterium]
MKEVLIFNIHAAATERNIKTLIKKKIKGVFIDSIRVKNISQGNFIISGPERFLHNIKIWFSGRQWHGRRISSFMFSEGKEIVDLDDYKGRFLRYISMEREQEIRQITQEIQKLSKEERQSKGRCLFEMRGTYQGDVLGGFEYAFRKEENGELPETEFKPGDVITLSRNNPLQFQNVSGTCSGNRRFVLNIILQKKPAVNYLRHVRIDLFYNESTYERMENAVLALNEGSGLSDLLLGRKIRDSVDSTNSIKRKDELNDSQTKAIEGCLNAKRFFLIHGPPGTGKTLTLSKLIKYELNKGSIKILVTADSNTAVDVLSEKLLLMGIEVLRVGVSVKINKVILPHTLDMRVKGHTDNNKIMELEEELSGLKSKLSEIRRPSQALRRGLTSDDILKAIKKKRTIRGIAFAELNKMAAWAECSSRISGILNELVFIRQAIIGEILGQSAVIATTNSNCASQIMRGLFFDLVVHDEATQATETSSLIPISMGKRFVLAGDHRQLPPTVLSKGASKAGYSISLFERLIKYYPNNSELLLIQYRMNEKLCELISHSFYSGKLKTAAEVRSNYLDIALGISDKYREIFYAKSFSLYEVKGVEEQMKDSKSYMNRKEAEIIGEIVSELYANGFSGTLGIISGYSAQKQLLRSVLSEYSDRITVDTVDGFQGSEKDVIIFSITRSNERNDTGFLKDRRRINVAFSRAAKKLIVVGDKEIFDRLCKEVGLRKEYL